MRHVKILQKARLSDDLFESDRSEPSDFGEPGIETWDDVAAESEDRFAVAERTALTKTVEEPLAGSAFETFAGRTWNEVLADLTGDPSLESCRTLGVCSVDRRTPSTQVVASIARWMAQFAESPPLLVETRFRSPRLAATFGVANRGIAEVILSDSSADRMTIEVDGGRLHLLPCGEARRSRSIARAMKRYPELHSSLVARYSGILLNLPSADSSDFARLPVGALCEAVILVVDSRAARQRAVESACRRIRESGARLAAVVPSVSQTVDNESRRSLQMRWHATPV